MSSCRSKGGLWAALGSLGSFHGEPLGLVGDVQVNIGRHLKDLGGPRGFQMGQYSPSDT